MKKKNRLFTTLINQRNIIMNRNDQCKMTVSLVMFDLHVFYCWTSDVVGQTYRHADIYARTNMPTIIVAKNI